MDVKFKVGLCNCQPSRIDDYGKYQWEHFMHSVERHSADTSRTLRYHEQQDTNTNINTNINIDTYDRGTQPNLTKQELDDIERIASCSTVSQLDNYATWIKFGTVLNTLGAPLQLWEDLSRKSTKYRKTSLPSYGQLAWHRTSQVEVCFFAKRRLLWTGIFR